MKDLINKTLSQKGQALLLIMLMMFIGVLVLTPALSLTSTTLRYIQIDRARLKEFYAADAGVKYAVWYVKANPIPSLIPPQVLNPDSDPVNTINGYYVFVTITGTGPFNITAEARQADGTLRTQIITAVTRDEAHPNLPPDLPYNILDIDQYDVNQFQ